MQTSVGAAIVGSVWLLGQWEGGAELLYLNYYMGIPACNCLGVMRVQRRNGRARLAPTPDLPSRPPKRGVMLMPTSGGVWWGGEGGSSRPPKVPARPVAVEDGPGWAGASTGPRPPPRGDHRRPGAAPDNHGARGHPENRDTRWVAAPSHTPTSRRVSFSTPPPAPQRPLPASPPSRSSTQEWCG